MATTTEPGNQPRNDSSLSYASSVSETSEGTTTALNGIDKLMKQPQSGSMGTLCHGNPLTRGGKRRQMAKIMVLILIPIAALSGITINDMTNVSQQNDFKAAVRRSMHFVMETGQVIHSLQRERDMTALFCGSGSSETRMIMSDRYPETDRALLRLSEWQQGSQDMMTKQQRKVFATREDFMEELSRHRRELDHFKTSLYQEIVYYSDLTHVFIDWVYKAIQRSRDGSLWRKMVAYVLLVICKENMGVERSLGAVFYSNGSFRSHADYQWYLQKHFVGFSNRFSASVYSDLVIQNLEDALAKSGHSVENNLSDMRADILYRNLTKKSTLISTKWFDNMTIYMDAILEVQLKIAESVLQDLQRSAREDIADLSVTIGFLCITILVCPLIVITIQAVMSDVQTYAITLATQTNHMNKERQRTNDLLYQMIPRSIAEQLKRRRSVAAESFDQSTIFFSDLIGFSALVSESAPIQIVEMLNTVYNSFDSRISLYEVYKVETIGDSYMVASGVPTRIGSRHVDEICRMGLDLLHHTGHIEIRHMPGHKLQLRGGMHSGPVVAGIVGSKMPRYCLFGDTVNTASRMETNGRANAIQMTEAARNFILNDTTYIVKERGIIEVKGKTKMMTYWLLNKIGFEKAFPCMPDCKWSLAANAENAEHPEPLRDPDQEHQLQVILKDHATNSRESCDGGPDAVTSVFRVRSDQSLSSVVTDKAAPSASGPSMPPVEVANAGRLPESGNKVAEDEMPHHDVKSPPPTPPSSLVNGRSNSQASGRD